MSQSLSRLAAGVIIFVGAVFAQNSSATISGTVQDPGGSVISQQIVRLTEERTGFVQTAKTNQDGFFLFSGLNVGSFVMAIEAVGFKRYEQKNIELSAGDQRNMGEIRLQLGDVSQSVSVTAEVAPVNLTSGERAPVLLGEDIERFALRGRDIADAVSMLPGVVDLEASRDVPGSGSFSNIFIAGGRNTSKNISLDGITILDTGSSTSITATPSLGAVSEVKVLMSNYAAENGRNSGGSVLITTKGGSKQFHGQAGWYHRHEQFTANDYFNNQKGLSRPRYRFNIFNWNLGGPVYVPGLVKRENTKLFFFFSQEYYSQLVAAGQKTQTVPTQLQRNGDFSQTYDTNGKLISILDPLNSRVAFPSNVIPASRFNATGQKVLNFFPLPNFQDPNPVNRYQWNFIADSSGGHPRRTDILRVDYQPHRNVQLYLRLNDTADQQDTPYSSGNLPITPMHTQTPGHGASINSTATLPGWWLNEARFGISGNSINKWMLDPQKITRQGTGIDIPQWYPGPQNSAGLLPNMSFGGVQNAGNVSMADPTPYSNRNTINQFADNISKVYRTHALKFGLYFELTRKNEQGHAVGRGAIKFDKDTANPLDSNYAYSNALLGIYQSYTEATTNPYMHNRFYNLEFYAQDTWKVNSRLSIDYGLRVQHDPPQYTVESFMSSFVPSLWDPNTAPVLLQPGYDAKKVKVAVDPRTGNTYPAVAIGAFVPNVGNYINGMIQEGKNGTPPGIFTYSPMQFAPRLGFAFDPLGKGRTALRGGAGVFYERLQSGPLYTMITNPPTVYTPTAYYGTLPELQQAVNGGMKGPTNIKTIFGQVPIATVYNYSLGIQQQIGHNMVADVSYVGSLSRHLSNTRNLNGVPWGSQYLDLHPENRDPTTTNSALSTNFLRPYTAYGDISNVQFGGTANYNSLQAQLSRRFRNGFGFGTSYTFSKALGVSDGSDTNVSFLFNPRDRNYGPLTFDRTHVFSARYNYEIPRVGRRLGFRVLSAITDGWELAGTYRAMSGQLFTPGLATSDGENFTGTPSEGARVQVLDPDAPVGTKFTRPASRTSGNAGVGIIRAPGLNNFDTSIYRRIRLAEKKSLQLRFESYNTFNHTQFSNVNRTARFDKTGAQIDPTFYTPTSAYSARRLQLAMTLNW